MDIQNKTKTLESVTAIIRHAQERDESICHTKNDYFACAFALAVAFGGDGLEPFENLCLLNLSQYERMIPSKEPCELFAYCLNNIDRGNQTSIGLFFKKAADVEIYYDSSRQRIADYSRSKIADSRKYRLAEIYQQPYTFFEERKEGEYRW